MCLGQVVVVYLHINVHASSIVSGKDIKVTGGGAYKYADQIKSAVGLPIDKVDEMKCIVNGCNFLMKNISDETFVYQRKGDPEYKFQSINPQVGTVTHLHCY